MPRNAALLPGLLVLIVVSPSISGRGERVVIELIFNAILLAGVYAVGLRRHGWAFAALTVVTLGARWGEILFASRFDVLALGLTAVWLVYAASVIIASLFQRREVETDAILGAIVVYLLVGLAFMMVFQVLELTNPGSFSGLPDGVQERPKELASSMLYFSLVCLTTIGYGDIVPVSDLARPLSVLEAVFGQLYLAVMIARLVGLHIARSRAN
ncbi:MAG TPA: ion channel [Polyangiales bacterium]|nr:ion channel [Polyangiales bacterium]